MRYIYPVRAVYSEGDVKNLSALLTKQTLQIGLKEKNLAEINGRACIVLDYGKELSGGARILTFEEGEKKTVRLRFGESVSEACAEIGEKNAGNDHSNRDFKVDLRGYSDMTFGQTGFRFLRIDTKEGAHIRLKSVVAACDADERAEIGSFECDDERVNAVWHTAAHTLRLCLHNGYFWDGVKRDRLVWIGDLYPEFRAAHCLFGDVPETKNSLSFAREENPLPEWISNMPSYSLWWLIILHGEYRFGGDLAYVKEQLPYIRGIIDQISACVGEDGVTAYPNDFIDWPSAYAEGDPPEKPREVRHGMNFLTRIAVKKAGELLAALGESEKNCAEILRRLEKNPCPVRLLKQVAALGAWAGADVDQNVVLQGGERGMTTFMSYPVLTATAKFGGAARALSAMKNYYGAMLDLGATTFWEDFDVARAENAFRIDEMPVVGKKDVHGDYGKECYVGFRHSLCHGWSAGVIPFLTETVLGIGVEKAGCAEVSVRAELGDLKYAAGTFPTPRGNIEVRHARRANGSVETRIKAPEGVIVRQEQGR